jgi:type III pantothenate kinase
MLLTVDIGNTAITFGLFRKGKLAKKFSLSTRSYSYSGLKKELAGQEVFQAIISSVVPKATLRLRRDCRSLCARPVLVVGENISVPIKNLYRDPRQVGQDRLVNAYAAVRLYGAPAVVVDFGTAVTFDVISARGEYRGGMIIPGLRISLEALAEKTALLPAIKLGKPKEFIGRDTRSSMLSGIIYGYAALTDELTRRICVSLGKKTAVIATGGNVSLLAPYCKQLKKIDPSLTLKGLNLISSL